MNPSQEQSPILTAVPKPRQWWKGVVLVVVVSAFVYFLFGFKLQVMIDGESRLCSVPDLLVSPAGLQALLAWVRSTVEAAGTFAVFVYLLIYIVTVLLPVPGPIITWAGAWMFGFWKGLALAVVGANIGVLIAFWLARWIGRDAVENYLPTTLKQWDRFIESNGLLAVLFIRLFPLFPFNVANYLLGVTALRTRDYMIGSVLGMLPFTAMVAWMGAASVDFNAKNPYAWLPLASFLLFLLLMRLLQRKMHKRLQVSGNQPNKNGA